MARIELHPKDFKRIILKAIECFLFHQNLSIFNKVILIQVESLSLTKTHAVSNSMKIVTKILNIQNHWPSDQM